MSPRTKTILLIALFCICTCGVGGCRAVGYVFHIFTPSSPGKSIAAEFKGLDDRKVAILVSADESLLYEYADVREQLSLVIAAELEKRVSGVSFVPPYRIVKYQDSDLGWRSMERGELGRKFGADFVLQINLMDYGMLEKGSASLYRGRITAEAELYNTTLPPGKTRVWRNPRIQISYPEGGRPVSRIQGGVRDLRYKTDKRFADALVKKFYDHKIKAE